MRKAAAVFVVIISAISMLMTGCSGRENAKSLEMDRLQSDTGAFQFYDLEWESDPITVQETLGIPFGQPDTAGGFQIYRAENAYTWNNVNASVTCEYKSNKLYTVTLLFRPEEIKREEFWSAIKEELFNQYGTVEGDVQSSTSDKLNISTESENYLWKDQSSGETMMSVSELEVNGEFQYIGLRVYVMR